MPSNIHVDSDLVTRSLADAGYPLLGSIVEVKNWGRARIHTADTSRGVVWIKHSYRLPPGEEEVIRQLAERYPHRLPKVAAVWSGGFAMEPLLGDELTPEHPLPCWTEAARELAQMAAAETHYSTDWLKLGVRDRRPCAWGAALQSLRTSPVLDPLPDLRRQQFEQLLPLFLERYESAFEVPATLVLQDAGCCNIHVHPKGPTFYDVADVVIGHPVFTCDRLLDQTPDHSRTAVIDAFCEPLGISIEQFRAARRCNVLHEVLRYHDELRYIDPADPAAESLANSVRSQLQVLLDHELKSE